MIRFQLCRANFAEVHRLTGERLSYWGTIGTQQVLPFGTPEEVRETVVRNLRICGASGGILICPTHRVEPEVPWENLVALRDAARDFRVIFALDGVGEMR